MNNETTGIQNLEIRTRPGSHVYASDISGAATDSQLVAMWLSGRPANTVRAYRADIDRFRGHVDKPIRQMTAADLIGYAETLTELAAATQHRKLSVVKSLYSFAQSVGYIGLNPAAALRLPKPADTRASKIVSVEAVHAVIDAAKPDRDRLMLRTLYLCGLREAELVALQAADIELTPKGHTLTVHGKGDKLRVLALPPTLAADLIAHRDSGPIFQTIRHNPLNVSDVYRTVRQAGDCAGYRVTPHIFRHACASHALDNGAPLSVVRDTLGHTSLSTTSVYVHAKPSDCAAFYLNDAKNSGQSD